MTNIAIVVSDFNDHITGKLLSGCVDRLIECGIKQENLFVIHVPGAVEIPLTAKLCAKTGRYDAIICLGAVIRGETDHYDYVCQQVSNSCQQIMMNFDVPVIFGVLTTLNDEQAEERVGGSHGHKGVYAADAALRMIEVVKAI